MAHILIMPRQGNTVESCVLVEWKVQEGDAVTEETTICNVETDKAAFEVPAGANGTVLKILCDAGDDVPVLAPIAVIGAEGENWEEVIKGNGDLGIGKKEKGKEKKEFNSDNNSTPEIKSDISNNNSNSSFLIFNSSISPRARNLAAKEALPFETVTGTGPGGRIIERDVKTALETRPPLTAAAKALKPDTVPAAGSGIGSRITTEDLTSPLHIPQSPIPDPFSIPSSPNPQSPVPVPLPLKGIRKIIADRMLKSVTETAQFTLNASAPVGRLMDIRTRINNSVDTGIPKISVNDLVLFAVSRVLPRFTYMNAHKTGDTITVFENVHLGFAVDTTRGLMVPVIRYANLLSLAQISLEAKRLAKACQDGNAKSDELSGSTFTVTNLGNLGITSFTPVLNIPEVAILGVCNIELKPVTQSSSSPVPVYEHHIGFSLTINHQVVDGAPAARFLKALGEAIANIDLELICTTR